MVQEQSGKMELHITHELSRVDNLRRRKRPQEYGDNCNTHAVVEIRGGSYVWRRGRQ